MQKFRKILLHYRAALSSCKLEDCLLVIKEILAKQKKMTSQNKRLGEADQRYLKLAERLACKEFAAVLHTTPDVVKKRLHAAMRRKASEVE